MCLPAVAPAVQATITAVTVAASVAGTAVSIAGQNAAAKAQAAAAETNEMLALAEAAEVHRDNRLELFKHGIESRHAVGTQEAIAAASNLDLTFGSAKEILGDRFRFSAIDSMAIASGARSRSTALRNSAAVFRSQSRNIDTSRGLNTAATTFRGITDVLSFADSANSQNRLINSLGRRK